MSFPHKIFQGSQSDAREFLQEKAEPKIEGQIKHNEY